MSYFTSSGAIEWLTVDEESPAQSTPLFFPFFAEAPEEWAHTVVPAGPEIRVVVQYFADRWHTAQFLSPRPVREIGLSQLEYHAPSSLLCRYNSRTTHGHPMSGMSALSIWSRRTDGKTLTLPNMKPQAKKPNPWPHKCPACGGPALSLFTSTECSRFSCKHYVIRG